MNVTVSLRTSMSRNTLMAWWPVSGVDTPSLLMFCCGFCVLITHPEQLLLWGFWKLLLLYCCCCCFSFFSGNQLRFFWKRFQPPLSSQQVFPTAVHTGAGSRWLRAGWDLRHKLRLFFFFPHADGDLVAANQRLRHAETKSVGSRWGERQSEVRVGTFSRS